MSFELSFIVSFVTAGLVSFVVASVCETPLSILTRRIIQNDTSRIFTRYVRYVTILVGIAYGVTVNPLSYELAAQFLESISIRHVPNYPEWWMWLIGILTIIMQSLTAIASMYLVFFIFGLIAYITVKVVEK
ncbi:MAG: hypothetical protein OXT74_04940 [Candidatus Poribacteria bacterium]|nr:hypothetical protein [Candidatus Poribacteria bacterium]